jgi:glutathione S-transferase
VASNSDDPERREAGRAGFKVATAVLEDVLADREYLIGEFSVADVIAGSVAGDGRSRGLLDGLPNVAAWDERLRARPARVRTDAIGQ